MAKVNIYPSENLMIKRNGSYENYDGSDIDVGSTTPVDLELKCTYSDYCVDGRCTYSMFQDNFTERQLDAIYREYKVTYIDDNSCESSEYFSMVQDVFTRPVDDVSSAHPKKIGTPGGKRNNSYWWDTDSAFATTPSASCASISSSSCCQGICNGYALSCYTEFYEAYAYSDDPRAIMPTLTFTQVPTRSDWWCIPIEVDNNSSTFNGGGWTARTDIFSGSSVSNPSGTSSNCYGLRYNRGTEAEPKEPFYLPERRSNAVYATQLNTTHTVSSGNDAGAYSDPNGPQYRYGKFKIVLSNTVDSYMSVFNALNKLVNDQGISISYDELCKCACLYYISSYNDETFTATMSTDRPRGFDPSNWFPSTISGKTVHFMSPVETFIYQKNISYAGPTTFTYTVSSNIVGATVEWTGATPVVDTRAAGNSNKINSLGYAKATNTTGGNVSIRISMDGYQFDYGGVYTLTENLDAVTINGSSQPTPASGCDYLVIKTPGGNDYTYTVRSNINGATVNFVDSSTGDGIIKQISNGSCSFTTAATVVNVSIASYDQSCVFSPNSATMRSGGTVTLDGTCGGGSTQCTNGSTAGLGSGGAVDAVSSATAVWVGNWTKSPDGCDESWSYDSSRSISGASFINTSTLNFKSDGTIFAVVNKTNTNTSQRYTQIPTKLGSVKTDYFTIYQKAAEPPTPTNYTYTVSSNTVGAMVSLWNNGTQVGSTGTIGSNYKYTLTTTVNATLSIVIWKTGCTFPSNKTVSPNGTTSVSGSCNTCDTCAQVNIGNISGMTFDSSAKLGAMFGSFTASCNPSFTIGYITGVQFISSISVASVGDNKYVALGNIAANTSSSSRQEQVGVGFTDSTGTYIGCTRFTVWQSGATVDPCVSESMPNPSPTGIGNYIGVVRAYPVNFNSNCWDVVSAYTSDVSLVAARVDSSRKVVYADCKAGYVGASATITVNLKRAADGATGSRTIPITWRCTGVTPSPTAITHSYNSVSDEIVTINNDCWTVYDVSVDQDPPGYSFVSARYTHSTDYDVVIISCQRGQKGYNATVTIYLQSLDGSERMETTVKVTWN